MREINEYTQEVFRRSEKRINERKRKRNRILAVCLPFCLIFTVLSVIILPGVAPAMLSKNSDAEGMVADYILMESLACSYTEVEIQGVGIFSKYCGKVTDKAVVDDIFSAVYSLFEDALKEGVYEAPQSSDESLAADDYEYKDKTYQNKTELASKLNGYTIIFTDKDGSQSVYNLSGNILSNVSSKEVVVLSDTEVAELMTVFGISE